MSFLRDKQILLISPELWGINFVSKHHYAKALAKNNQVYFLNPPSKLKQITKVESNLYIINCGSKFRGLGKMPAIISAFLIKYEIHRLEKLANVSFDIIWNFDSSRFFNLKQVKYKLKIAHLVDLSQYFQRPLLCQSSDVCFCTSEDIATEMRRYNSEVHVIGHGYQPSEYRLAEEELSELACKYSIKAAYIGNLTLKYIDWKIILTIIRQNPDTAFFFIGPTNKSNLSRKTTDIDSIKVLRSMQNVFFLGAKNAETIPAYLEQFDILLLIYKSKEFKAQLSNPHKVLEYLGSGNVAIASWTDYYKNKRDLIEMAEDNNDLPAIFKIVKDNLDKYNQSEKKILRRDFAYRHTYNTKINEIGNILKEISLL